MGLFEAPENLYGKKICVNNMHTPKLQLSADCPVTEEFRQETNQWMESFFGVDYLIPTGTTYIAGDTIFMNPETLRILRKTIATF